jgi:FkbM family methyltransferase
LSHFGRILHDKRRSSRLEIFPVGKEDELPERRFVDMRFAKLLIKGLAARAGYEIRKIPRNPSRLTPDARFGLNVLGYLVEELLAHRGAAALSLLEVGANDGRDEDSVHDILKRHTIPAILCEPLPDAFTRLTHTYGGFDHVQLAQCAIASYDGELELYRIAPGVGDNMLSKIASFDRDHVEYFRHFHELPAESVVSETVPCKTIRSLLAAYSRESIDIAVVDTEGMDHLICSQILELSPPPTIVQFEYCNSPIASVKSLMERLTTLGYRFSRSGLDITAARPGSS